MVSLGNFVLKQVNFTGLGISYQLCEQDIQFTLKVFYSGGIVHSDMVKIWSVNLCMLLIYLAIMCI